MVATTAEVTVSRDGASGFLGAIKLPKYDVTIPFAAEVEEHSGSDGGAPGLRLRDFRIGTRAEQLSARVDATFRDLALKELEAASKAGEAGGGVEAASDGTYTIPVGAALQSYLRASKHPVLQSLYYTYHSAVQWVHDHLMGQKKPLAAGSSAVERIGSPEPNPELVVCEFTCPADAANGEITFRQRTSAEGPEIEVCKDHRHLLTWAIGTYHDAHLDRFDALSQARKLPRPFRDITIRSDRGLEKAKWYGPVLNAHLSRFTMDPHDPCAIDRHVIELVLSGDTVFSVDQSGDYRPLIAIKDEVLRGTVPHFNLNSVGALAAYLVERTLRGSDQVLDRLDDALSELEDKVKDEALSGVDKARVPALQKTLRFYARKLGQNTEVFNALKRAPEVQPTMFGGKDPELVLNSGEQSLRSLLDRSRDMLARVDSVERQHDSRRKERTDRNIELLTIPVGAGVPPILGDIVCKTLLKHHEAMHDPLILASFVTGAAMVALALATDWKPLHLLTGGRKAAG